MNSVGIRPNQAGQEGFSLMECVLAILVVALGILAVFALLPSGLTEINVAAEDLNCALFAGETFGALQGRATTLTNAVDWDDLDNWVIEPGASTRWSSESDIQDIDLSVNIYQTNVYYSQPLDIIDHAHRWKLTTTHAGRRKTFHLNVKPGRIGPRNNQFYTEVYRCGM